MKSTILMLISLLCGPAFSQSWQQAADFPSTERDDGASFVIGNTAYCGTGLMPWFVAGKDFYSLDMSAGSWEAIAELPAGNERQYASGFSDGSRGFITGGVNGSYFNDLWIYDPVSDSWNPGAPLPSAGRMGAANFVIGNTAYIVGGRTSANQSISEVWAYNMLNNTWVQKNNLPFGARWRASGASMNNKGYLLFGKDENNSFRKELMEYDPGIDSWSIINIFPGNGRTYSSMNASSGKLLVTAGLDTLGNSYNDFWSFHPDSTGWQQLQPIPAPGRRGGMSFTNNTSFYYTTGTDQSNTRIRETWKVENTAGIQENNSAGSISCFPNPADESCTLMFPGPPGNIIFIEILDLSGRLVESFSTQQHSIMIRPGWMAAGTYLVKALKDRKNYYTKLVVAH
ncbi:MAG TPA: kelch repeat-containing protein [Bacteroidia bacterium]|jgi:N-acetylneuraminic acid mutarotase